MKDDEARASFKVNPNSVISWILAGSYSYYILDEPILSDTVFDNMCKYVFNNWDKIEHQHKHLFTKEDMENGSLFMLKPDQYPLIVQVSVGMWVRQVRENV